MSNTETQLLRNYRSRIEEPVLCKIWEAARATSAAPTFFNPITFPNGTIFRDGALRDNNPIFQLVREAKAEFPSHEISTIVSLGTGVPGALSVGESLISIAEACSKIATDTEKVADNLFETYCSSSGVLREKYFRFNVNRGLSGVGLEEWHKQDEIWSNTLSYLKQPEKKEL
jgi:predicted acylesterase/phospholipase RssA